MKVLVVDDEPLVLNTITLLLTVAYPGWQIVPALGGPEAISLLRSQNAESFYDVVITDCNMPEKDGFDVCREAKGLRFDVTVIMASGLMDERLEEEAICAGVTHCLKKPFTLDKLQQILEREPATA